jgi:hypothetical protein
MPECHVLVLGPWRSKDPRLVRQLDNLKTFVEDHKLELDVMPFEPWTISSGADDPVPFSMQPSTLVGLHGLLGVMLNANVERKRSLVSYPGALMPQHLYERFDELFHCPTAVELKDLKTADGETIYLVGDPTAAGPIINAPVQSNKNAGP